MGQLSTSWPTQQILPQYILVSLETYLSFPLDFQLYYYNLSTSKTVFGINKHDKSKDASSMLQFVANKVHYIMELISLLVD